MSCESAVTVTTAPPITDTLVDSIFKRPTADMVNVVPANMEVVSVELRAMSFALRIVLLVIEMMLELSVITLAVKTSAGAAIEIVLSAEMDTEPPYMPRYDEEIKDSVDDDERVKVGLCSARDRADMDKDVTDDKAVMLVLYK